MPWKECSVMDERLQFVARRLAGEAMSELCREFGISRKTGYKIFDRYQECGVQGLTDRSRRPYRYANQLPFQVENYILNVKREHGTWGARKIRERLIRRFSGIPIPAKSTIHAVAWWSAAAGCVVVLKEPSYPWVRTPMSSGARISRASSCWGIINTATR
jgi:transposase